MSPDQKTKPKRVAYVRCTFVILDGALRMTDSERIELSMRSQDS